MADYRALILQRHRRLKWKAFDWLEALLMILCGVCIFMFTLTVLCDVVTRTFGVLGGDLPEQYWRIEFRRCR